MNSTKQERNVIKTISVKEPTFVLEMTQEEADFLYYIMCNVGGPPEGPRGVADRFIDHLNSIGIEDESENYCFYRKKTNGGVGCSIFFKA